MKDYELYLFDLDGTLVNTEEALYFVFNNAYRSVGISILKSQVKRLMRIPLFQGYEELHGPDNDEQRKIFANSITYFVDHKKTLELSKQYPETNAVIQSLKNKNKTIGIVTSNSKKHTEEVLSEFGIDGIDVIIGNLECKATKPSPEPVLNALKALNYQGDLSKVCYIGDGLDDMKSGTSAGIETILLDRYDEYDNIREYRKIHSLEEIIDDISK